jgi:hypothetical protein
MHKGLIAIRFPGLGRRALLQAMAASWGMTLWRKDWGASGLTAGSGLV